MTTATQNAHGTTPARVLFVSFALREKTWKLGCTTGHGQTPRERTVAARPQARVLQAVAQAKRRCGLPETAPVVRGDAAGRAGFWLPRFVQAQGITNPVVDASAIAGNRRQRRAKRDALDVRKLLRRLRRSQPGERDVWRVVPVPSVDAAEQRPLHRDLDPLQQERARTTTRRKGLLRSQGVRLTSVRQLPAHLDALRLWDGSPLPSGRRRRVLRVSAPHPLLSAQSAAWAAQRRALLRRAQEANSEQGRQLRPLRGIGSNGSWVLGRALFGWRALQNRREGGA